MIALDPIKSRKWKASSKEKGEAKISTRRARTNPRPRNLTKRKLYAIPLQEGFSSKSTWAQEHKKRRKRNARSMAEDVINSNFATVTMNFRTTDWLLPRGLQQNYGAGDYLEESQRIEPTTQELVKLNKDFIRCGSLATFNYINKIMAEHPSIYSDSEDIQIRRDILKTIVKGMHHWDDGLKDSDDSFSLALTTLEPLKTILGDNDAVIQRVEGYLDIAAPSLFPS
ncbi:hypothetical protein BC939DRAFT_479080 [Gamsiella multidivaricata]|uniref:uncharacterized protein n=1 Tax=Gamsiella multidivaricata TaxID=101098 RepID=UPI00222039DB|nr:uncharacterized protein BC939DRAFT_479080 [Gamsiella multidivaricata]KAI7820126.1 hypothetical protein BC939DRAFT_479080 [Gamsiella multidivaricata]